MSDRWLFVVVMNVLFIIGTINATCTKRQKKLLRRNAVMKSSKTKRKEKKLRLKLSRWNAHLRRERGLLKKRRERIKQHLEYYKNKGKDIKDIKTKGALSLERRKKYLQTRIDYWISRDMPKGAKA